MKEIELDALTWVQPIDFYSALLPKLGAPPWHGHNLDAVNDSIFTGNINAVEPPLRIIVNNTMNLHNDVRDFLHQVQTMFDEGRKETGREAHIEFNPQL